MKLFRSGNIKRFFALATGLVFLNMSFFLTELSYMELETQDKKMLVNLVRLLSGISEEETDAATDSAHEGKTVSKTVDLFHHHHHALQQTPFIISLNRQYGDMASIPISGALDTILQPPELINS